MLKIAVAAAVAMLVSTNAMAQYGGARGECGISGAKVRLIQNQLATVVLQNNGGLFSPNLMWSAIVDRAGVLCSVIKTGDAWPGSRAIAIAKATTANAFSNQKLALSTAMLY